MLKKITLAVLFIFAAHSVNAQLNFSASNTGLPAAFVINDFQVAGADIWGAGSYFNGSKFEGRIYKSADNGTTWAQVITSGLDSLSTGNALLNYSGTLLISGFISGNNYSVFASTDGGSTWSVSNTGLPAGFVINEFRLVGTDIYGAGSYFNGTNFEGRIFRSADIGATWTQIATTSLTSLYTGNSLLYNSGQLFISGSISNTTQNYSVYVSSDYGMTWTVSNSGLPSTFVINEFRSVGADIYGAGSNYTGSGFEGRLYKSGDNGATWTQITTTGLDGLYTGNALLFNNGKLFVSGSVSSTSQGYSVFVSSDVTKIANLVSEEFSIYPNPFHNEIRFDCTGNEAGYVSVYDISGNMVRKAAISATQSCLDLSGEKSGIYFIQVSIGQRENKPVIMTKD